MAVTVSTTSVGHAAEAAAAHYLIDCGYTIVERNFRRPYCEIDLVMQQHNCVYFVEVKYRSSETYGSGLEYIGIRKLQHMERAAQTWILQHRWTGDYALSAVAVTGRDYIVTDFIESIV